MTIICDIFFGGACGGGGVGNLGRLSGNGWTRRRTAHLWPLFSCLGYVFGALGKRLQSAPSIFLKRGVDPSVA